MKEKPKQKRVRRAPEHYVNNREFSTAVVEYLKDVKAANEAEKVAPRIPRYIGECFLKISEGLSHKPNFIRYTYREEMVMDAVENCVEKIYNFRIDAPTRTGLPNAFAYFTQISWYAFIRRINKENKQQDIKEKYIDFAGISEFADFDESGIGVSNQSIIDTVRAKREINLFRD